MANWPVTIPQDFLREGFSRTPQPNVISFGTEVGEGKARRRSTARVKVHTASMQLTLEQAQSFEAWFEDDLKDGALSFQMADPFKGDFGNWKFDTATPHTLRELAEDLWLLSMTIRRIR
jgi:hypothetical protein